MSARLTAEQRERVGQIAQERKCTFSNARKIAARERQAVEMSNVQKTLAEQPTS